MSAEDVFKRAHALPSQAIVIVDPMNPFMSPEAIDIVCDDAAVRKNAKFLIEEIVRSNKLDECCDLKHFKQLVSEITNSTELVISSYVGVPGGQLSLINKMAQNVDEIYRLAMEYKEPGRLFKNPHKRLNNAVIAQKIKLLAVEIAASM
jgi:hypothetical protein